MATRCLPYIVGVVDGEWGYFLHIQPVDVLLEQTKQGKVQGSQPGLLALENKLITQWKPHPHIRQWSENARNKCVRGSAYFGTVAVVKRVLYHQILEHLDGYLTDLPELLQSCADLSEQHPDQEVVLTEVICQWVVQLEVWGEEEEMWQENRIQRRHVWKKTD